ncbi:MAG: hypothetical protein ACK4K7_11300 [Allosphingosinicella sp.]|uniref:hypothetical protein n=1 Tax=Allosphingosinicella sp. TaxID=2823234 RepID=UPI003934BE8E
MQSSHLMVVLIVSIVMIASVLRAKYGYHHRRSRRGGENAEALESAETARLRDEVKALKDRVIVLERIATDKNHLLEQEFERLRDR